eukprot:Phypoly_transcript_13600.p1 GENE.Phypoly_transcript_13600~~Phypoly_transcript_13600.p1  ORF type:complete len:156 (+),score=12.45 Phypoly_transcript_13600:525-992(+)
MSYTSKHNISKIIYGFCIIFFIFSVIVGLPVWKYEQIFDYYSILFAALIALLCVFFIIIGKDMVKVLLQAPSNNNKNRRILILKIVVFILWYVSIVVGVVIVYAIGILGPVFVLMLVFFFEALGISVAFLILFFQPFRQTKYLPTQISLTPPRSQ